MKEGYLAHRFGKTCFFSLRTAHYGAKLKETKLTRTGNSYAVYYTLLIVLEVKAMRFKPFILIWLS